MTLKPEREKRAKKSTVETFKYGPAPSSTMTNILACPECGAPMKERKGRYGTFLGCTKYSSGCRGTRNVTKEEIKAAKKAEKDQKFEDFKSSVDDGTFYLRLQTDRLGSKYGVNKLPIPEAGTVWITGNSKKELKHIDIEVLQSENRYGGWYYLINRTDLERFPYLDTMDTEKKITAPDGVKFVQLGLFEKEIWSGDRYDRKPVKVLIVDRVTVGKDGVYKIVTHDVETGKDESVEDFVGSYNEVWAKVKKRAHEETVRMEEMYMEKLRKKREERRNENETKTTKVETETETNTDN